MRLNQAGHYTNGVYTPGRIIAGSFTGSLDWSDLDNVPDLMSGSHVESQWTASGANIYYDNGSVSIGTSSLDPASKFLIKDGAVNLLEIREVNGNSRIALRNSNNYGLILAGIANDPYIGSFNTVNFGRFASSIFQTNPTSTTMTVDVMNGYVGIGTATPTFPLEVVRANSYFNLYTNANYSYSELNAQGISLLAIANPQSDYITSIDGVTIPTGVSIGSVKSGGVVNIGNFRETAGGGVNYFASLNGSAHSHRFFHNRVELMRIEYTGYVGIGTSFPTERMHVSGNILASSNITSEATIYADSYFTSTDTTAVLSTTGAGNIILRPNGAGSSVGQFQVESTGRVSLAGYGVGTFAVTSIPYLLGVEANGRMKELLPSSLTKLLYASSSLVSS